MDHMEPLTALSLWRDLHDKRAEYILQARAAGTPWKKITAASGMSYAMVKRLAQHEREAAKK